ncbi:hypothetical protein BSKO_12402 [Bryopsis sp. KO-2023]|nr:hypothetical protein BSKO_12402 [Bryopsis sp. KO-2023]
MLRHLSARLGRASSVGTSGRLGVTPGGAGTWCRTLSADSAVDCVVIGAGVIGLAVARALTQRGREVLVLEEEKSIGTGISSRNSEVIHGGLYYKTNTLKALLCVEGKKMLYDYCKEKSIPHKRIGKLIVATNPGQLATLGNIAKQAKANGVQDVEEIDKQTAQLLEPEVSCVAALLSPSTGIVDSHSLMESLRADAESGGALFSFGAKVVGGDLQSFPKQLKVKDTTTGEITALTPECIVNAAGLQAWDVAKTLLGATTYVPHRYYARGCYFSLQAPAPFSRLVYPIPEDGGLGVHMTLDLQGKAKFGPDVQWIDQIDYTVDPERALSFYPAIRKYYPNLPKACLQADYAGIRPKVVGPGEPPGDFLIQGHSTHIVLGFVNLFGIESPGLTASLAIGEYVAEMLDG